MSITRGQSDENCLNSVHRLNTVLPPTKFISPCVVRNKGKKTMVAVLWYMVIHLTWSNVIPTNCLSKMDFKPGVGCGAKSEIITAKTGSPAKECSMSFISNPLANKNTDSKHKKKELPSPLCLKSIELCSSTHMLGDWHKLLCGQFVRGWQRYFSFRLPEPLPGARWVCWVHLQLRHRVLLHKANLGK